MLERLITKEDIRTLLKAKVDIETRCQIVMNNLRRDLSDVNYDIKNHTHKHNEPYTIEELCDYKQEILGKLAVSQRFLALVNTVKKELESEEQ